MRIIDPEIISKEEKMLFHSLNAIMEPSLVQASFREKFNLEISPKLNFTSGDMVYEDNKILFNLFFEAPLEFSVLIDRMGNHLGFVIHSYSASGEEGESEPVPNLIDIDVIRRREKEIVNAIAGSVNKQHVVQLFENENKLKLKNGVHFKDGEITSFNDTVAYKLNFESEVQIGMLIDRRGKFLKFTNNDSGTSE
jgi:hypothetical protein